jgi:hypothetical protein
MQQLGLSPGSTPKRDSRLLRFLWPDLSVLPEIGSAIDMGKLASFGVAILSVLVAFLQGSLAPLVDGVLFLGLGFGIARRSRICSVLAFTIYFLSRLVVIGALGVLQVGLSLGSLILAIAFTVLFFNAMRGAFAYHSYKKRMTPMPEAPVRPDA